MLIRRADLFGIVTLDVETPEPPELEADVHRDDDADVYGTDSYRREELGEFLREDA